tara:strand:- start:17500 stop:17901 length:402 start_codon:yes stop_codon:yes gene_type:complete
MDFFIAVFFFLAVIYVVNVLIHMGNGWNNKNIKPLVDKILYKLNAGEYTVGRDDRWAGGGVRNTGGSILTCYKNGQINANGILLDFCSMFVRSTWVITDEKGRGYYTGYIQGLRLHKKIKEIYKKEKKGNRAF